MLAACYRLRRRNDFRRIYARGASRAYASFIIYRYPSRSSVPRIGVSASKKLGGAVQRNRGKRRMRAVCGELLELFSPGYDYVFILRGAILTAPYAQLREQTTQAILAINTHGGRR
ncbi:MAG: ribonuclease P protein component [Bacillota bacterium]|nr:ribonuclease P protein component [Bacillota bacterium]